jgi:FkbM family methyltransferase
MISYAQNHEDVVLARAFTGRRGFYIDVGAASPVIHSVTKHFYDRGWLGINIEPVARWHAELVSERRRDVNLAVGLGDSPGSLDFFDVSELDEFAGESTFSREMAESLRARGVAPRHRTVEVTTLAMVCEEHVTRDIDFLKVDVEGFELEVLSGGDWDRFRPVAVVVESVFPRTSMARTEAVSFMEGVGYRETLFEGQNRFFVRDESEELVDALSVPANVTDEYEPVDMVGLRRSLDSLVRGTQGAEEARQVAEEARQLADTQRRRLEAELGMLRGEFDGILAEKARLEEQLDIAQHKMTTLRNHLTDAEIQFRATREALDALLSDGARR